MWERHAYGVYGRHPSMCRSSRRQCRMSSVSSGYSGIKPPGGPKHLLVVGYRPCIPAMIGQPSLVQGKQWWDLLPVCYNKPWPAGCTVPSSPPGAPTWFGAHAIPMGVQRPVRKPDGPASVNTGCRATLRFTRPNSVAVVLSGVLVPLHLSLLCLALWTTSSGDALLLPRMPLCRPPDTHTSARPRTFPQTPVPEHSAVRARGVAYREMRMRSGAQRALLLAGYANTLRELAEGEAPYHRILLRSLGWAHLWTMCRCVLQSLGEDCRMV